MIFISHANPEDNEFARWLAVRLAGAGFEVWSDITKLIGGEKFWIDIEKAIKEHCQKFLLCVTKSSHKPGVMRELDWALQAEAAKHNDMVVPLKLDDTPFSSFPKDLGNSVTSIRFDIGWAAGLMKVLEMLKRDGIRPRNADGSWIVSEWWRQTFPVQEGVQEGRDVCIANLFPTVTAATKIWYHPAKRPVRRGFKADGLKVIAEPFGNGFVSFCSPGDMHAAAARFSINTNASDNTTWRKFIDEGYAKIGLDRTSAHRIAYALLRRGFERHAEKRGCRHYNLSQRKVCYWLIKDFLPTNEASFAGVDGRIHARSLVGFKTMTANKEGIKTRRYWHFAVQGLPTFEPNEGIILKTHIVFTQDGEKLFDSDSYQHRSRRNQAKSWWNDEWRDRLLAMMSFLADGNNELSVNMSEDVRFSFSTAPIRLVSDQTYVVIDRQSREDLPDDNDEAAVLTEESDD
jgi:hypothetical protein